MEFLRDAIDYRDVDCWSFLFADASAGAPRLTAEKEWKSLDSSEDLDDLFDAVGGEDSKLAPVFMRVSLPKSFTRVAKLRRSPLFADTLFGSARLAILRRPSASAIRKTRKAPRLLLEHSRMKRGHLKVVVML